jgi:hypothetical protein
LKHYLEIVVHQGEENARKLMLFRTHVLLFLLAEVFHVSYIAFIMCTYNMRQCQQKEGYSLLSINEIEKT